MWQILLSSPFVLCRFFFLSVISFCCKQHLCTLDKFNNHDSIYNPYWAVSCFILPIKISTQRWVKRGPIPATETLTERRDAQEPWKSRCVTEGCARQSLRLSTRALSLSLIPPLVSEKPLSVIMRPLLTLLSSAGKDDSSCPVLSQPLSPSASHVTRLGDRSDISLWHRSCSVH